MEEGPFCAFLAVKVDWSQAVRTGSAGEQLEDGLLPDDVLLDLASVNMLNTLKVELLSSERSIFIACWSLSPLFGSRSCDPDWASKRERWGARQQRLGRNK